MRPEWLHDVRTTLTLDPEVEKKLKAEMRRTGRSFKSVVNEALREGLARRRQAAAVEPFVVEARPLGLVAGLDYSNVAELLEVAEGPAHG